MAFAVQKLKHLEHVEDHLINEQCASGFAHAVGTLKAVHAFLKREHTETKITTKYDGAPSIVFGFCPENHAFFVATKSAFNVNFQKLNFSDEDIDRNHTKFELATKLKTALKQLPKIMLNTNGVYQGDVMYLKSDVVDDGESYSFCPNTVQYSVRKDSVQGKKVAEAEIGIVVHARYCGKTSLKDMVADLVVDHTGFQQNSDVHLINPDYVASTEYMYTDEDTTEVDQEITSAATTFNKMNLMRSLGSIVCS